MRPVGSAGEPLAIVRESIEVDAPVANVYQAWSNFENFPEFMANVKDIRKVGDVESVWVTRVMGVRQEWRATTTRREENRSIAWQASGDVGMSGRVNFTEVGPNRTRVDVEMEWKAQGIKEGIAEALGIDDHTVKRDLKDFKEYIEGRKAPRTTTGTTLGGTGGGSTGLR